jgi:hypothetical protein
MLLAPKSIDPALIESHNLLAQCLVFLEHAIQDANINSEIEQQAEELVENISNYFEEKSYYEQPVHKEIGISRIAKSTKVEDTK